jgi:hypothetical protein
MSKEWTTNLEGPHQRSLVLGTFVSFLATLVILAIFQSSALVTWSYDLPVSTYSETISRSAEEWHALMEQIGTATFSQTVSDAVLNLHDEWPVSE